MEVCQELTFQLTLESGHTYILELIQSELNSKICFMYVYSQDHVCANTHTHKHMYWFTFMYILYICVLWRPEIHIWCLSLSNLTFFFKELIFHWVQNSQIQVANQGLLKFPPPLLIYEHVQCQVSSVNTYIKNTFINIAISLTLLY